MAGCNRRPPRVSDRGGEALLTHLRAVELPPRLAVIGAGPIGCELAQAFARFGSHVTLLEVLPQILSKEDRDAAAIIQAALRRDGVDILTGVKITGVEQRGNERVLRIGRGLLTIAIHGRLIHGFVSQSILQCSGCSLALHGLLYGN